MDWLDLTMQAGASTHQEVPNHTWATGNALSTQP